MVQSRHSYEGVVVGPPDHGATKSGKEFCRFSLKVDNKTTIDCVIWNTVCSLDAFLIEPGSKVSVRGFWSDDKDKPAEFVVRWFEIAASSAPVVRDFMERIYEYYGGKGAYELALQERATEFRRRGFVQVVIDDAVVWQPKRFCVKVGDYWHNKMEFIMDQLGAERVTKELMSFIAQSGQSPSPQGLARLKINPVQYGVKIKEFLDKALLVYEERFRNPS